MHLLAYQLIHTYAISISCYYLLKQIDKYSNETQNLSLRIILTTIASILTYSTLPTNLQLYSIMTVVHCSVVFMVIIRLFYSILYDAKNKRQKKSLAEFLAPYKLTVTKNDKSYLKGSSLDALYLIFKDILFTFMDTFILIVIGNYLSNYLTECLDDKSEINLIVHNYIYFCYYSVILTLKLVNVFSVISNIIGLLVRILTMNQFDYIQVNNYPFLSISIKEMWSKRYNQHIKIMLHSIIFTPLINYGYSSYFAAFITFLMSGILHSFITFKQIGGIRAALFSFCFFTLHGMVAIIETYIYKKMDKYNRKRNELSIFEVIIRIITTNIIVSLTLPLYIGLFIETYPESGNAWFPAFDTLYNLFIFSKIQHYLPKLQCIYPTINTLLF